MVYRVWIPGWVSYLRADYRDSLTNESHHISDLTRCFLPVAELATVRWISAIARPAVRQSPALIPPPSLFFFLMVGYGGGIPAV